MKKLFRKLEETLADAALLEMGMDAAYAPRKREQAFRESLENHLVEIAFAEAANYDEIHEAILREHIRDDGRIHPDDCHYGDNDACFAHQS